MVTGTYSCPLALHSPPHWVTSTPCHTKKAAPQKAQGPDQVHGPSYCCYFGSSDPLDSPQGEPPPIFGVLLFCCLSAPASPLWVLGTGGSWEITHYPAGATRLNREHPRKRRPTSPTLYTSMFFVLWSKSLRSQCGPSLLEILQSTCPTAVHSIQCPTAKIFWQNLQKTSWVNNIFSRFQCSIFAHKVAPQVQPQLQGDHPRLSIICVGHHSIISNIFGLYPWFLTQSF